MPPKLASPQSIVFIGAECTGKTTLATEIAKQLDASYSAEYVREYAHALDRPLEARDLDPIARGQLNLENKARSKAQQWVVHDTNLLSSILYAEHYFDVHIPWVDEIFLERNYARYYFCQPDMPWEADPGQRVSSEERDKLHLVFEKILERYGISPVIIAGSISQRIQMVMTDVAKLTRTL